MSSAIDRAMRAVGATASVALPGGHRSEARLLLHGDGPVGVLRRPRSVATARREVEMARRFGGTLPIPPILWADLNGPTPLLVHRWIPGRTLASWLDHAAAPDLRRALLNVGALHPKVAAFAFPAPGFFGEGLEIGKEIGPADAFFDFVEPRLVSGRSREILGPLADDMRAFLQERRQLIETLNTERSLVHGDFAPRNVLVADDGSIAGLIDWEFAHAGTPLFDLGILLRHLDREGDVDAVEEGMPGTLSPQWRLLARMLDVANLCDLLDRSSPALPAESARERFRRLLLSR